MLVCFSEWPVGPLLSQPQPVLLTVRPLASLPPSPSAPRAIGLSSTHARRPLPPIARARARRRRAPPARDRPRSWGRASKDNLFAMKSLGVPPAGSVTSNRARAAFVDRYLTHHPAPPPPFSRPGLEPCAAVNQTEATSKMAAASSTNVLVGARGIVANRRTVSARSTRVASTGRKGELQSQPLDSNRRPSRRFPSRFTRDPTLGSKPSHPVVCSSAEKLVCFQRECRD